MTGPVDPVTWCAQKFFPTKFHMIPKSGWHNETPCSIEAVAADARHLPVYIGDSVIDGIRFTCVPPGGTVFAPTTGVEVVVPVTGILSFGLELRKEKTRGAPHIPHCCREVAALQRGPCTHTQPSLHEHG